MAQTVDGKPVKRDCKGRYEKGTGKTIGSGCQGHRRPKYIDITLDNEVKGRRPLEFKAKEKVNILDYERQIAANYRERFRHDHPDFNPLEALYQELAICKAQGLRIRILGMLLSRLVPELKSIEVTGGPDPIKVLRQDGILFQTQAWKSLKPILGIEEKDFISDAEVSEPSEP